MDVYWGDHTLTMNRSGPWGHPRFVRWFRPSEPSENPRNGILDNPPLSSMIFSAINHENLWVMSHVYPPVIYHSYRTWPIEIVDSPFKDGDFPVICKLLIYQRVTISLYQKVAGYECPKTWWYGHFRILDWRYRLHNIPYIRPIFQAIPFSGNIPTIHMAQHMVRKHVPEKRSILRPMTSQESLSIEFFPVPVCENKP